MIPKAGFASPGWLAMMSGSSNPCSGPSLFDASFGWAPGALFDGGPDLVQEFLIVEPESRSFCVDGGEQQGVLRSRPAPQDTLLLPPIHAEAPALWLDNQKLLNQIRSSVEKSPRRPPERRVE